uniref:tRNA:m(4)X modification enzyme TRM13 n=1 Tax=Haemonchus contortus TaxID=6289 RepID=A0A7I4YVU1_HAECO
MLSTETIPNRCMFVLPKKGRGCRMLTREGQKYCGEHAIFQEHNEDRIPCPNDPKHTVNRRVIRQHLMRCNSRVIEEQWIVKDMNAMVGETKFTAKLDRRADEQEIACVLEKLQSCYCLAHDKLLADQAHYEEIDGHLEKNPDLSESKRKHLVQLSSIIGHLLRVGLLRNDSSTCTIELGAGKAQLTYWLTKRAPLSKFLLIDRSGARNKFDNKALQENPSLNIKRLRCSIEHLNLAELEMLKDVSSCAVCKHFCGSATDAGIRCLSNGIRSGVVLDGFVLVPCCHHKSRYSEYSGREFLAQWNMDSESDFAALRHIATWAVCGFSKVQGNRETHTQDQFADQCDGDVVAEDSGSIHTEHQLDIGTTADQGHGSDDAELTPWSPMWKEEMGRRAKVLLEMGRAQHLASLGFTTQVIEYVPRSVSPENLLILGFKPRSLS